MFYVKYYSNIQDIVQDLNKNLKVYWSSINYQCMIDWAIARIGNGP